MNNTTTGLLTFWLGQVLVQLPGMLVALVAFVAVLVRRDQAPRGSAWALLGFGLAVALGLLIPIGQVASQRWMMATYETRSHVGVVLTGLALLWNLLHAAVYALLLVAFLVGRSAPPPPRSTPPPLPRPGDGRPA